MTDWHARAVALLLALVALTAAAEPLSVTDRYPVTRIHALPAAQDARLADAPARSFALSLDWSSYATARQDTRETLILDGESVALTARWRRTAGRWRLGVDVPAIYQSGGALDGVIDAYHDLFGFPDGDRPELPDDELLYRYDRDGQTILDVNGGGGGLGDITLHAARTLRAAPHYALALRAHLKVPTGDSERLLGSGAMALGMQLDGVRDTRWGERAVEWYGGLGVQVSGRGDVLASQREKTAAYGNLGVSVAWHPALSLIVQLDGHSPFYDSDQRALGSALMLSAGGRFALRNGWRLELAVAEDVATRTAPDVTFHLGLAKTP